jgi:TRAP-type C4-dicarboxylate transport system permease small subunit
VLARSCFVFAAAGVGTLLGCAALTVVDVLGRRLADWSLPGLIDLTQLLVMTGVFLCLPYTFERRANVEVDLLHARLPAAWRAGLDMAWALAAAAFLGAVTWFAAQAARSVHDNGEASPTLGWPMLLYWLPLLLGCSLAAWVSLSQAWPVRAGLPSTPTELP